MKSVCLLRLCPGLFALWVFTSVQAEPIVHRAVEPAQILLDVSLKENALTLYLTIPGSVIPFLAPHQSPQAISDLLAITPNLWTTQEQARCTLTNHKIFTGSHNTPEDTFPDIDGFFAFDCRSPQYLSSISPQLQTPLPGLKLINIWLTTDRWQNKQSLVLPEGVIKLKPESS